MIQATLMRNIGQKDNSDPLYLSTDSQQLNVPWKHTYQETCEGIGGFNSPDIATHGDESRGIGVFCSDPQMG